VKLQYIAKLFHPTSALAIQRWARRSAQEGERRKRWRHGRHLIGRRRRAPIQKKERKAVARLSSDEPTTRLSYEELQTIRRCIIKEEESQIIFDKIAARIADENLRMEFVKIAEDCRGHAEKLTQIYHGESDLGKLPSIESDLIHLLENHLRSEEDLESFYDKMAKNPRLDEKTKLAFLSISLDERSHHARIRSLIQLLQPLRTKA